jgi:hypothetical protein
MNTASAIRIVDENLNRLSEGLRVLEDLARMILDDASLTQQLKSLRHDLVRGDLAFNLELCSPAIRRQMSESCWKLRAK